MLPWILSILHTPSLFQVLSSFSHVPPLLSLNETDGWTNYEGNWNSRCPRNWSSRLRLQLPVRLVLDDAQGLPGACMLHTWWTNSNMTWLKSKLKHFDAPIHIKIDYRALIIFNKWIIHSWNLKCVDKRVLPNISPYIKKLYEFQMTLYSVLGTFTEIFMWVLQPLSLTVTMLVLSWWLIRIKVINPSIYRD